MNPIKILLAEDNPVNQKVAELMMKRLGYSIDIEPDGEKAIEAFKRNKYEIILMDAHMPVMDGLSAARWIREHVRDDEQPKILVMTATMLVEAKEAWKGIDVDGFIEKPVRVDILKEVLESTMEEIIKSK